MNKMQALIWTVRKIRQGTIDREVGMNIVGSLIDSLSDSQMADAFFELREL